MISVLITSVSSPQMMDNENIDNFLNVVQPLDNENVPQPVEFTGNEDVDARMHNFIRAAIWVQV